MNSVEKVKALCKERHIAISKLERDCGFSNGYINQLRRGVFTYDRLIKIAEYLGISPDELANAEKEKTATSNDDGLTQEQRELMNLVPSMTQSEVLVLLAAAKAQEAARRNQSGE